MKDPVWELIQMARACNRQVLQAIKDKDWGGVIDAQDDRDYFMRMARG